MGNIFSNYAQDYEQRMREKRAYEERMQRQREAAAAAAAAVAAELRRQRERQAEQERQRTRQEVQAALEALQSRIRSRLVNRVDENDYDEGGKPAGQGHSGYYSYPQTDWRGLRKANKSYTQPSGQGRRKKGRKGRGDLFENDYHAGYSKSEIQAMSSARKAAYEAQHLKRQHQEVPQLAA